MSMCPNQSTYYRYNCQAPHCLQVMPLAHHELQDATTIFLLNLNNNRFAARSKIAKRC